MIGKIKLVKGHNLQYSLFLDDVDISKYTRSIDIKIGVNEIPRVTVELIGLVEIPDEVLASIEIYKSEDEDDKNTH